jgi:hypothetical protein
VEPSFLIAMPSGEGLPVPPPALDGEGLGTGREALEDNLEVGGVGRGADREVVVAKDSGDGEEPSRSWIALTSGSANVGTSPSLSGQQMAGSASRPNVAPTSRTLSFSLAGSRGATADSDSKRTPPNAKGPWSGSQGSRPTVLNPAVGEPL